MSSTLPYRGAFLLGMCAAACDAPSTPPPAAATALVITEARARELVLFKYRALFADKYFSDSAGQHHLFPAFEATDFNQVQASGEAWSVRRSALGGVSVAARVAKDGAWVELNSVKFEPE